MHVPSIPSCVRVVCWSNIWSRPLLFPIYLLRRSLRGIFHLLNALSMFAFSLVSPFQETSLFVPLKVVFAVVHNNNTMKNFHPGFATGIYVPIRWFRSPNFLKVPAAAEIHIRCAPRLTYVSPRSSVFTPLYKLFLSQRRILETIENPYRQQFSFHLVTIESYSFVRALNQPACYNRI